MERSITEGIEVKALTLEQLEIKARMMKARSEIAPSDPFLRGTAIDAVETHTMLKEQADQYERQHKWLWRAIYVLLFTTTFLALERFI